MNVTAIICEYNPMTNAHVEHLRRARTETGADTVLCVMSGSFTQRGDAAVADKYLRAEQAIHGGADIVVELPTLYAISPADNFAYGAVKTISAFPDVRTISFGSECGNADILIKLSDLLIEEPDELKELLRTYLDAGNSFPKSRALAVNDYADRYPEFADIKGILDAPNNVLGIAYMTAVKKAGLPYAFHTIKRIGGGYNDDNADGDFPSASAVRKAMLSGERDKIAKAVPAGVVAMLERYKIQNGSLGDMALFKIKNISGYDFEKYYDVSGGIHNRLLIAANQSSSLEELLENAKTKKYTMARLKRLCLYALFDITREFYEEAVKLPPYLTILALNKDRRDILSELSRCCKNVLERYSDVNRVDKALRPMIKLDFTAQGTLEIINHETAYIKKMLIV